MEQTNLKNQLAEVAQRIRTLREIMGITVEEMANNTGVSLEDYKKYESGSADFSFTFIYKCAKHLSVDPTDLIKGESPTLSNYSLVRAGDGLPITRREGFKYLNMAPLFKNKTAEPFYVEMPYVKEDAEAEIRVSTHEGQEMDILLSGVMKFRIGEHTETLYPGDCIYYDSSNPHGMVALSKGGATFYAIVLKKNEWVQADKFEKIVSQRKARSYECKAAAEFIETHTDEKGVLDGITFRNEEHFNFAFDIVDAIAKRDPEKLAMLHVSSDGEERRFTFGDMSRLSAKAANMFEALGIGRGDKVMLVLKRHWQFWVAITALHKIGAVAIPATHQLMKHDLEYRFEAADVKAMVSTGEDDVYKRAEEAFVSHPETSIHIMANGKAEGWYDFDGMLDSFSDVYERRENGPEGTDVCLMFFTSGTTGYPKIAMHDYRYALGHFITAKYWHNVNPDGLHFTVSDTGWGKALWGKYYGQWMAEAAIFTYDFERFNAKDVLPMFKKYGITTFCAPPTIYRFLVKEDISGYDLSSLEYATTAGEALNPEVFEQWKRATGLTIMEGFGQTETTLTVFNPVGTAPVPGAMGKPSPMYDVDLIDADGNTVAIGETGEIVVKTEKGSPCGLFKGYYKNEEKTREAHRDGVYHTGDTAWRDELGYFHYVGRTDDLIKSSGYRIGPFEIESVIMELPYVLECAITAAPDEIRGQVIKATVVLVPDKEGTDEVKKEIQKYVKEHTAPYKYPRIVEFRDSLPKTISGKIKRTELR